MGHSREGTGAVSSPLNRVHWVAPEQLQVYYSKHLTWCQLGALVAYCTGGPSPTHSPLCLVNSPRIAPVCRCCYPEHHYLRGTPTLSGPRAGRCPGEQRHPGTVRRTPTGDAGCSLAAPHCRQWADYTGRCQSTEVPWGQVRQVITLERKSLILTY